MNINTGSFTIPSSLALLQVQGEDNYYSEEDESKLIFYLYSNLTEFGSNSEITKIEYEYYLFFHEERIKEGTDELEMIFFE